MSARPLRARPAAFINLQYGDCDAERERLARRHGITLHHWREAIDDYEETAALACALDLTVSICTAVVHVCGAQGRPVWVLTPVTPEARYGRRGPGMRCWNSSDNEP